MAPDTRHAAPQPQQQQPPPPPPNNPNYNNSNMITSLLHKLVLLFTVLLRTALYPLRYISYLLFPPGHFDGAYNRHTCDAAAKVFAQNFQRKYVTAAADNTTTSSAGDGDNSNRRNYFVNTSYTQTLTSSFAADKCVLVYLHSPLHPSCDKFCEGTLGSPAFLQFLSQHGNHNGMGGLVVWGGEIHTADAAHVASLLHVRSFPFLALLASSTTTNTTRPSTTTTNTNNNTPPPHETLLRIEGHLLPPSTLLPYLTSSLHRHTTLLQDRETRRLRREEEVRLRQEQDLEYQETLARDRLREEQRRLELEQAERLKKREQDLLKRREERLEVCRSLVASCPEPTAKDAKAKTTTRIRLTLPNGKRVDRRFYAQETLGLIRAFLLVHFEEVRKSGGEELKNFGISTSYPKRQFKVVGNLEFGGEEGDGDEDAGLTLADAGLVPHAVIMVTDLDA